MRSAESINGNTANKAIPAAFKAGSDVQVTEGQPVRDAAQLWSLGLNAGALFDIKEPQANSKVEMEALKIIARHLARQRSTPPPREMTELVEFQRVLQLRSKVVTAVAMVLKP